MRGIKSGSGGGGEGASLENSNFSDPVIPVCHFYKDIYIYVLIISRVLIVGYNEQLKDFFGGLWGVLSG